MYDNGTIKALAWPDTKVIREGKWYDVPMKWVGAIKNEYWTAGHAACLLINNNSGEIQYCKKWQDVKCQDKLFGYQDFLIDLLHYRTR